MTANVTDTSTRKVDSLVKALGVDTGISKPTVSRICAEIDTEVEAFRNRPFDETTYPYVWLDATYLKAPEDHRIVSRAVVMATAVTDQWETVVPFLASPAEVRRVVYTTNVIVNP